MNTYLFRKMLIAMFVTLFILGTSASAMTFSQPKKLGVVWGTPMGGIVIEGASKNSGEKYKMRDGK